MPSPNESQAEAGPAVTRLLSRLRQGDEQAGNELFSVVYSELRKLASAIFSDQNTPQTLQPTALVHEAWLKLANGLDPVDGRRHFFMLAGRAMRQVVTDYARARRAQKRGGVAQRLTLDTDMSAASTDGAIDLLDLDEALVKLAKLNERHARVAEQRLFSGLTIDETADALGLSPRSVDSDWAMAKAWLVRTLHAS